MTDDDLRRLFESHSAEIRRHFDVSTEEVQHEVRVLAEGLTRLDQKLDRTTTEVRDEMRRGFADTQAMIKFSHAEFTTERTERTKMPPSSPSSLW